MTLKKREGELFHESEIREGLKQAQERGVRERAQLADRLRAEHEDELASKLDACGSQMAMQCTCCGNTKSVEVTCRRRWCPACAWLVKRERLEKFQFGCSKMQWPLFITLTARNSHDPECIREVRANWGKFRRRKLLATKILGGLSTIEVTNIGNGWHPHLHVLCDCEWLALHVPPPSRRDSMAVKRQKYDHARLELSALWAAQTKQQVAVVSALRKSPEEALKYAVKYAVKGADLIACRDKIGDLIRVLSRSRMVSAFGNMHGMIAEDDEAERPAVTCLECGNEKSFMPLDVIRFYGGGNTQIDQRPAIPKASLKS